MLKIVDDERALAAVAAEDITSLIERAIRDRDGAFVSLTGGSSPRLLYHYLADAARPWRARIDWPRVHLFWGDERHVPPEHPDSNFGMANEALVSRVPIPAGHVHRMRGEMPDAGDAADEYAAEIAAAFREQGRSDRTFDVMLLGLGENVHIASLFPGSPLLSTSSLHVPIASPEVPEVRNASGSVAAVWVPELSAWRITLTPAALLDSRMILMIVAGAAKADAVWWALEGPEQVEQRPAQLLRRAGDRVEWIIDRPAAGRLRAEPRA